MQYGKFFQKVFSKWRPFQRKNYKWNPTPGCIPHRNIVGHAKAELLFSKYADRPQKAINLYWRTHPAEYKAMLDQLQA